ncbi:MAG: capsular polysaccharide biosynthesis protein [Clostridia bacterium]|nr:capsular polysaccharide biosynthesis protein [Clostridia bacterium]
MQIIDFHSHVLPAMDDGSRSTEQSVEMLRAAAGQGVTLMAATPHFYAHREAPDAFLKRRERCLSSLLACDLSNTPALRVGAEVYFYRGMSRTEELRALVLEGTDLLLVEMPFEAWSSGMLDELRQLRSLQKVRVVLAHVERYFQRENDALINEAMEDGFLIQCNAEAFRPHFARRVWNMMAARQIDFIGSDCHNTTSRAPNVGVAAQRITKRLGEDAFSRLQIHGMHVMGLEDI